MKRRAYPTDLTDSEWELIKPLLPSSERKRKHSLREVVNALFYQVRGGAAWRMLPHDFPPWETVYGFFNRWSKQGGCKAFMMRSASRPACERVERRRRARPFSTANP
jgi:transposase